MAASGANIKLLDVKTILGCNRKLKQDLVRVVGEFMQIRDAYLKQLPEFVVDADRQTTFTNDLKQFQNNHIQELESNLGIVVFGPNSSGKSSFIQYFLQIGDILPSGVGPVTACIIKMTYAPAERARALVYSSFPTHQNANQSPIEIDLKSFFLTAQPQWSDIKDKLSKYLNRLENYENTLAVWAKTFVEIHLPSPILQMNIDIYDTPGFLSGERESVLLENLYELVKKLRPNPTLLFLYENPSIAETDANCFLAMKKAIGSLDRTPVFFLNTKADVATIVKDSGIGARDVTQDCFQRLLKEARIRRYELLREQTAMANELLGGLPDTIDKCVCFDICSIPKGRTPWRAFTECMNKDTFYRIISFGVQSNSVYADELAADILRSIEDFFDITSSSSHCNAEHFQKLRDDALYWSTAFFAQLQADMPKIAQTVYDTIVELFDTEKLNIITGAAKLIAKNDPVQMLLPANSKKVRDYVQIAVEEKIMKVAVSKVFDTVRSEVRSNLGTHFDHRMRRKNELLTIAQRQILPEISPKTLTEQGLFNKFIEGLIMLPMRIGRLLRSLPTRYFMDYYNKTTHTEIKSEEDATYKILDSLDLYASLSDEGKRLAFAEQYLNVVRKSVVKRKQDFEQNLKNWSEQQQTKFNTTIKTNYNYIVKHLKEQYILHNINMQYFEKFARIQCQILAARHLNEFDNTFPTIISENTLGKGAFFSIYAAEWSSERNLVVKKLSRPIPERPYMAYIDAHYQWVVSLLNIPKIVPLKYLYENELESGDRELWIVLPRYSRSLRDFLCENIQNMTLDKILRFAIDIAQILAELHHNEIVHRDIKASNILLDENDECYLTDFGTAKEGTMNNTIIGTMPLPPEMVGTATHQHGRAFTYDGTAADIYSFGILLLEMCPKSAYQRIHPENFEDIKNLLETYKICSADGSAAFLKLIKGCVQQKPKDRPSVDTLLDWLQVIQKSYIEQKFIDVKECLVCLTTERQLRFDPCGHKVICERCWEELNSRNEAHICILCRQPIEKFKKDLANDETLFFD